VKPRRGITADALPAAEDLVTDEERRSGGEHQGLEVRDGTREEGAGIGDGTGDTGGDRGEQVEHDFDFWFMVFGSGYVVQLWPLEDKQDSGPVSNHKF